MELKLNKYHILGTISGIFLAIGSIISYVEDSATAMVAKYCSVAVQDRAAIRQLVNTKIAPNHIQISCFADEKPSN